MELNNTSVINDTIANGTTITGIGMYLMNFQTELTLILLITGVVLNLLRIYDRFKRKKKN